MPGVSDPKGILRRGWSAEVGDYAIAGEWTRDGALLVVGDAAGGLFAFDGRSGALRWQQDEAHAGGILAISVHPNGSLLATSGQDGRVRIWDTAREEIELKQELLLGRGWVEQLAWSPAGQIAASLSRRVFVYEADGREVWASEGHPSTISALAWSGAEELATACYGRVGFYDGASGRLNQELAWKGSLVSMVLSPDGDIVACGSQDNSVHFWRRSTGQDSIMSGYPAKPSALSFDDSGRLLATSGGEAVTVWSFACEGPEGTTPGVLTHHRDVITALSFSRRGMQLASGCRDGRVAVWTLDADAEGRARGIAQVSEAISGLRWRPDDRALAAWDAGGGVTVWRSAPA